MFPPLLLLSRQPRLGGIKLRVNYIKKPIISRVNCLTKIRKQIKHYEDITSKDRDLFCSVLRRKGIQHVVFFLNHVRCRFLASMTKSLNLKIQIQNQSPPKKSLFPSIIPSNHPFLHPTIHQLIRSSTPPPIQPSPTNLLYLKPSAPIRTNPRPNSYTASSSKDQNP